MIAACQDTARDFLVLRFVLWGWVKAVMSFRPLRMPFVGYEIVVSSPGNLTELWWFIDEIGLLRKDLESQECATFFRLRVQGQLARFDLAFSAVNNPTTNGHLANRPDQFCQRFIILIYPALSSWSDGTHL